MGGRRCRSPGSGRVPFLAYVAMFLLLPTVIIVVGAFSEPTAGSPSTTSADLVQAYIVSATREQPISCPR